MNKKYGIGNLIIVGLIYLLICGVLFFALILFENNTKLILKNYIIPLISPFLGTLPLVCWMYYEFNKKQTDERRKLYKKSLESFIEDYLRFVDDYSKFIIGTKDRHTVYETKPYEYFARWHLKLLRLSQDLKYLEKYIRNEEKTIDYENIVKALELRTDLFLQFCAISQIKQHDIYRELNQTGYHYRINDFKPYLDRIKNSSDLSKAKGELEEILRGI